MNGYILNEQFPYLQALRNFLINSTPLAQNEIMKRLAPAGALKLVIVAGVFIQNWDSRVDILIVGDKINDRKLDTAIRSLESEVGKELRYVVFPTKEFQYRLNVYDRLVRDVLDYPHQTVVDRLGSWDAPRKLLSKNSA